ncbi:MULTISPECIES: GntR family transcriptional regulator [unclassified Phenylobacterium]|uniref:GntR family transcriptional regulator n=1 Tax=unclassified Phenylobacterium TaxID=2640670 RepID=UPI000A72869E|nr:MULTISPECIES: GntR family transcriptional regulator [unclassified Phenylobacterium]
MPRRRDPFGAALKTLRERLADGDYPPGAALVIGDLAAELGFSTTPVREALAWLAGERLIEERRGVGFNCWRIDPAELLSLYDLHEAYLRLALQTLGPPREPIATPAGPDEAGPAPLTRQAGLIFRRIVAAGGSTPLFQAHASLTVRLGRVRQAESRILSGLPAELDALGACAWTPADLTGQVQAYHTRRRQEAMSILGAMGADSHV